MRRSSWLWPIMLLLSALIAWGTYALLPNVAPRPLIMLGFLTICPGMALVRCLHLRELRAEWTLAIATSLALDTLVASIQLYAGWWSPTLTLNILVGVCIIGALVQLLVAHFTRDAAELPTMVS